VKFIYKEGAGHGATRESMMEMMKFLLKNSLDIPEPSDKNSPKKESEKIMVQKQK
jgi:hypothetical protein